MLHEVFSVELIFIHVIVFIIFVGQKTFDDDNCSYARIVFGQWFVNLSSLWNRTWAVNGTLKSDNPVRPSLLGFGFKTEPELLPGRVWI